MDPFIASCCQRSAGPTDPAATCLCEFGCVTALHECPHCHRDFEYSYEDYHRQIRCPHTGDGAAAAGGGGSGGGGTQPKARRQRGACGRLFGFTEFPCSERAAKALRAELAKRQAARHAAREGKKQRQERAAKRASRGDQQVEEKAFLLGLADECPRCGQALEVWGEEEQRAHLASCDGSQHKERLEAKRAKAAARQAKLDEQESVQTMAAWQMLGADQGQLFLLDDAALAKHASDIGLRKADVKGLSREQVVGAIGAQRHHSGSGSTSSALVAWAEPDVSRLTPASVPPNYAALSLTNLRLVFAGLGLLPLLPPAASKADAVKIIEDQLTRVGGGGGAKKAAGSPSQRTGASRRTVGSRQKQKLAGVADKLASDDDNDEPFGTRFGLTAARLAGQRQTKAERTMKAKAAAATTTTTKKKKHKTKHAGTGKAPPKKRGRKVISDDDNDDDDEEGDEGEDGSVFGID